MKIEGKIEKTVERNGKIVKYYLKDAYIIKETISKKGLFKKEKVEIEKVPIGDCYVKIRTE